MLPAVAARHVLRAALGLVILDLSEATRWPVIVRERRNKADVSGVTSRVLALTRRRSDRAYSSRLAPAALCPNRASRSQTKPIIAVKSGRSAAGARAAAITAALAASDVAVEALFIRPV